jgi:regulator of sigma D
MTQDEIIEMARQAWADAGEGWVVKDWFDDRAKAFEAFAKLIAAKEREACAKLFPQPYMEYFGQDIQDAIRARGKT